MLDRSSELEMQPRSGWAVYTHDDPESEGRFRAFFLQLSDARAFAEIDATNPEYDRDDYVWICPDAVVVHAWLTRQGIVTSNNSSIKDHEALRAAWNTEHPEEQIPAHEAQRENREL